MSNETYLITNDLRECSAYLFPNKADRLTMEATDTIDSLRSELSQQAQALAEAEDLIKRIRTAVAEYHLALDRREHGGIAGYKLADAVQDIFGMPWVQGEALAGIEGMNK